MALTAGSSDYTLPTAILDIQDLYDTSSDQDYPLERRPVEELLRYRLNSDESSPAKIYALNGANLLMVYPTPASADTLTVYYVPRPTALSTGSDDPSSATLGGIPSEYHFGIELYAYWKAADYDDDQSSAQGTRYKEEYEQFIARMRRDLMQKGGRRLARARPGRPKPYRFHPSTDLR
jgi:hypothetical protein